MALKIGVLAGLEGSFPFDLVREINNKKVKGVVAEEARVSEIRMVNPSPFRVIVDRVSHVIEFFRPFLKSATLSGTYVINNPLWAGNIDKFFDYTVTDKIGLTIPKTVLLPAKNYPEGMPEELCRSLSFPLDWEGMLHYVNGFPVLLKPYESSVGRYLYLIRNWEDLMTAYARVSQRVMILQEYIDFDHYIRTFVIGKKYVLSLKYNPAEHLYIAETSEEESFTEKIFNEAILLSKILDYDLAIFEFAVREDVVYVADILNFGPDPQPELALSNRYYRWLVDHIARIAIEYAKSGMSNIKGNFQQLERVQLLEQTLKDEKEEKTKKTKPKRILSKPKKITRN